MRYRILFFISCFLFFVSPALAHAAGFWMKADVSDIRVGDQFRVDVFLDTKGEEVNAAEGTLGFPEDNLIELKAVSNGGGVMTLWAKSPQKLPSGALAFAGLLPGGFIGSDGFLFSLILEAKHSGNGVLVWQEGRILKNDGKGTPAEFNANPLNIKIGEAVPGREARVAVTEDGEPPEEFAPILTRDDQIFGGRWFLAFSAQDRGSGISHYEVREGEGDWTRAESPYELKNQELTGGKIEVKAVDRNGNERIVFVSRSGAGKLRPIIGIGAALFVVLIAFLVLRKKSKQVQG